MKFFIGPMSKNVTDTIIEYVNEYNTDIVFIPSRRQIENTGGYVNNWTTKDFCNYVNMKSSKKICIQRDHAGPGQGYLDDDGYDSLKEDCLYMDIIHIDPWKKYSAYEDGLKWTIQMLEFCYEINNNLQFEIGTEETIRPFSVEELENFLIDIQNAVGKEVLKQIKYVVVQCGTRLETKENTGKFSSEKLGKMLNIVNKYGFEAKEHNGDWVSMDIIQQKEQCGLSNINIAPEFGEIETSVLLEKVKPGTEDFEEFFSICHKSMKWVKWVSPSFNPYAEKELLIRICGHYIFSNPDFIKIKSKYINIDSEIKQAIKNKLHILNKIYYERTECIMCKGNTFETYFDKNYEAPLSFSLYEKKKPSYFMPFNIVACPICKTIQTKYLGNPAIIYAVNHIDSFGSVKKQMHELFSNFVLENTDITGIIEVGASTDALARCIHEGRTIPYTIIDPDFRGDIKNIRVIPKLLEQISVSDISGNTVLMSNLFEHLYYPTYIIQKLYNENIKYIYLNNPDLEGGCKSNTYIILNTEHIYYIENEFLYSLFDKYGFELVKKENYNTHSIFMKFQRKSEVDESRLIVNKTSYTDTKLYFSEMVNKIERLNTRFLNNPERKYYMWPAATYNIVLFVNGLNYKKLTGVLDNSPNKIGKKLYGYDIECFDFKKILESEDETVTIILGGSSDYRNELGLLSGKVEVLFLDDI